MKLRQAGLGAAVAVLLVFGAKGGPAGAHAGVALPASQSQAVCDGIGETLRTAAQRAGNVVLDLVLDTAGELEARAKQVF